MKIMSIIILIVLITISCAPTYPGVCRHNALYTSSIMAEKYETVVVVGFVLGQVKTWHAQTKSFINGKWEWIIKVDSGAEIGTMEQHLVYQREYSPNNFAEFVSDNYYIKE